MDAVAEIKRRLNIIDLVQEYVPMKKLGTNWKARCPFHQEKTPSFMVSEDKQIWHCFGCNEGGDILSFLQKIEGLEFPEALRILATKAHVTLSRWDPGMHTKRTRLFEVLEAAARWYHEALLTTPEAVPARAYARERGLTRETVEDFYLGFAKEGKQALSQHLLVKRFSAQDLMEAGLFAKNDRGETYDRFHGRLIFTLYDVQGQVVGFAGRILSQRTDLAKYINSPETPVYHKTKFVYNLHRAKHEIRAKDAVIVVEGYMDVITAYQAGIKNVVASSGTALTREQIQLLGRYTKNIFFAFDADAAGQEATKRAVIPALAADMRVRVVLTRGGKDPDEVIRKDRESFLRAVADAPAFMDYFFDTLAAKCDLSTADGKKYYTQEILSLLAHLPDPVEQQHYLQKLAERVRVDEHVLLQKFATLRLPRAAFLSTNFVRNNNNFNTSARTPSQLPSSVQSSLSSSDAAALTDPELRESFLLLECLFTCVFAFPRHLPLVIDRLDPEWVHVETFQELYKKLIIYYTHHQETNAKGFENVLTTEERTRFSRLLVASQELLLQQNERTIVLEIEKIITRLHKNYILEQLASLKQDIASAERRRETQKLSELTHLLREYTHKLHQLS